MAPPVKSPGLKGRPAPSVKAKPLVEMRVRTTVLEDGLEGILRQYGARAHLVGCRPVGTGPESRLLRWLDVEAAAPDLESIELALEHRFGAENVASSGIERGRAVVRISAPIPGLCASVFSAGGMCVTCPFLDPADDGTLPPVRVVVPRNGDATRLGRELTRHRVSPATMERMGQLHPHPTLTRRQETALRTALRLGYFEYPRRADLAEVARELGVGRSAALELIRRAVSRVAHTHYAPGGAWGRSA